MANLDGSNKIDTTESRDNTDDKASNMHLKSGLKRRWYDSVPNLSQAIDSIEKQPPYIQQAVVQSLNDYIDHYRRYRKAHHVSVGVTKIMGLYNSSRRGRWYDTKPKSRRAFNMMATVPAKVLSIFSLQVIGISDVVSLRANASEPVTRQDLTEEVNTILRSTYSTLTEGSRGMKITDTSTEDEAVTKTKTAEPVKRVDPLQDAVTEAVIVVPSKRRRQNRVQ